MAHVHYLNYRLINQIPVVQSLATRMTPIETQHDQEIEYRGSDM